MLTDNCIIGECCYDYVDENEKLLFQVVRLFPKKFFQRRLIEGKWVYNLNNTRKVLYRLPEVIKAEIVFIVEGEKDVENLRKKLYEWKYAAVTTCPGGSSSWKEEYNIYFKDKIVYIIPDNDDAGHRLAQIVAVNIFQSASSVAIVSLPNLKVKEDVSDWFEKGYDFNLFKQICRDSLFLNKHDIDMMKPKKHSTSFCKVKTSDGITSEMIKMALTYPIEKIIDTNGKRTAYCINPEHIDEVRSMDTKGNYCYCYGCGWKGTVIDLAMAVWECDFKQAVCSILKKINKLEGYTNDK